MGEWYYCEARIAALDHDGSIQLEFVKGRLAGIAAAYDLDTRTGTATKEFLRVGELLLRRYGTPSVARPNYPERPRVPVPWDSWQRSSSWLTPIA